MMSPHPADISVVVQGPVVGRIDDPPERQWTRRCLESIRRYFPAAELIFSTWKGADVAGLDCDILVENDDPGQLNYLRRDKPDFANVNRQIVSSRSGLEAASRPFAMKVRSDMVFFGTGVLNYLGRYEAGSLTDRVFRQRVVVLTQISINPRRDADARTFHPSDWFQFGHREDVLRYWSPPLAPELSDLVPCDYASLEDLRNYNAEQYLWLSLLRRACVKYSALPSNRYQLLQLSERSIAENLVLVDPRLATVYCLKYQFRFTGTAPHYTHTEWLRLYHKFCGGEVGDVGFDWAAMWRFAMVSADRMTGGRLWPLLGYCQSVKRRFLGTRSV